MIPETNHIEITNPREYISRYQMNFVLWAREVLGMEITPDQRALAEGLLEHHFVAGKSGTGTGKALQDTEPVLTPKGYVPHGSLQVGDHVIGKNGKPTQVLGVYPQGVIPTYHMKFSDGSNVLCSGDHLWTTEDQLERRYQNGGSVKTTLDIKATLRRGKDQRKNHSIPIVEPVELEAQEVMLDPYVLGVLIGDGSFSCDHIRLSNSDDKIIAAFVDRLPTGDELVYTKREGHYGLRRKVRAWKTPTDTRQALLHYKLAGYTAEDKFVPEEYKYNSISVRLKVLQGLMDTDGTLDYRTGKSPYYCTISKQLATDVKFLVESLGGVVKIQERNKEYSYKGMQWDGQLAYYIYVNLPPHICPFLVGKKKDAHKPHEKYTPKRFITDVVYVGEESCTCIRVAAEDSLYVVKDFIVTHNTAISAAIAIFFMTTRPESKVICTAPSGHQLHDLLFSEMRMWIRRMKIPFIRDAIQLTRDKFYIKGYEDWYIVARTIPKDAKDKLGDVLAGFHAKHLLFLIDESSGVADAVFAGLEGSMIQDGAYCMLVGNPTRPHGYFYDCFHKNHEHWHKLTLCSLNSPYNDPEYIERMRLLHGEESDFYKTKVLGEFPSGEGFIVATYNQIEEAQYRFAETDPKDIDDILVAGLDPGAGRNDASVLTLRKGAYVYEPIRIQHKTTLDLVPQIIKTMAQWKAKELYVEYDGVGITMWDQLKKKRKGFKVFKVVMSSRANDPEAYRNLRAELYGELSDSFDDLILSPHPRYMQEIPEIAFIPDKTPIQVMDKKAIKARLRYSPDYSDSLVVSTYRQFNIGSTLDTSYAIVGFEVMNDRLMEETNFDKI